MIWTPRVGDRVTVALDEGVDYATVTHIHVVETIRGKRLIADIRLDNGASVRGVSVTCLESTGTSVWYGKGQA